MTYNTFFYAPGAAPRRRRWGGGDAAEALRRLCSILKTIDSILLKPLIWHFYVLDQKSVKIRPCGGAAAALRRRCGGAAVAALRRLCSILKAMFKTQNLTFIKIRQNPPLGRNCGGAMAALRRRYAGAAAAMQHSKNYRLNTIKHLL